MHSINWVEANLSDKYKMHIGNALFYRTIHKNYTFHQCRNQNNVKSFKVSFPHEVITIKWNNIYFGTTHFLFTIKQILVIS